MMQDSKNLIQADTIIYDAEQEMTKDKPVFDSNVATPHCKVGDEILNGKVNWLMTLGNILATGCYTLSALSKELKVKKKVFELVLENNVSLLTFRTGAHLLALHERFYPSCEAA